MRKGHRFYVKASIPLAFVDIKRNRRQDEVRVYSCGRRQRFHITPHGLVWDHPTEVPRQIKRMAARACHAKKQLDKRMHPC
jgi:hypothetical protein